MRLRKRGKGLMRVVEMPARYPKNYFLAGSIVQPVCGRRKLYIIPNADILSLWK